MFSLEPHQTNSVRIGKYAGAQNFAKTPCYFMISNFGGGGTNVSRVMSYLDIFDNSNSQLLLNYYYMNNYFVKNPGFDSDSLAKLTNGKNIMDFLVEIQKEFVQIKKRVVHGRKYVRSKWTPITLLDSGSGNIFRDLVEQNKLTDTNFDEVFSVEIERYLSFAKQHSFDIVVSFDIAGKYTHKKGEHQDDNYKENLAEYKGGDYNLRLAKISLINARKIHLTKTALCCPLHGKDKEGYLQYLNDILQLEKETGLKFDGFALGGLGKIRQRDLIYSIIKLVRKKLDSISDVRPLHVLGVGAVQNIIPFSLMGADSSDCHSPWRRASEGKFITPLLNSKFKVVATDKKFWSYVPINEFNKKYYSCDCPVCKKYSLNDLRKLLAKKGESEYYAKILFFRHNIAQQEFLCQLISKGNLKTFIETIPQSKYKEELTALFKS